MSHRETEDKSAPKAERWIFVMLASFVPMLLIPILPNGLRVPLVGIAVLLLVAGFVLMIRKDRGAGASTTSGD